MTRVFVKAMTGLIVLWTVVSVGSTLDPRIMSRATHLVAGVFGLNS